MDTLNENLMEINGKNINLNIFFTYFISGFKFSFKNILHKQKNRTKTNLNVA